MSKPFSAGGSMSGLFKAVAERAEDAPPACRLCGGETVEAFRKILLSRYSVCYWRCSGCGSLETEEPYWLDEAYAKVHSVTDTGMAARTLAMAQSVSLLLRIAGVDWRTPCLDWGGGNGLFTRLMRDQGFNFYNDDKYAEPYYCAGFTRGCAPAQRFEVLTSFEVFEHLPSPGRDLLEIVKLDPRVWLFSTQLYERQGPDWEYLAPATGRHVFFYSEKSLARFAAAHNRDFIGGRDIHMFVARGAHWHARAGLTRHLSKLILRGGKLPSLAAGLHYLTRQRHAYRHWQADREAIKRLSE